VEIIPVIDLLHGKVVRAQRGERDRYLPIQSQLCDSCEPLEVVRSMLGLYPFKSLYIADLNAIQSMGNNFADVAGLLNTFPEVDFWMDAGLASADSWPFPHPANIRCILGSEALNSAEQYLLLASQLRAHRPILSLDFNRDGFLGAESLLQPGFWPQTVICMTLAKVGSYEGPDWDAITGLATIAPMQDIYAAGGIRDFDDLKRLVRTGVAGALIASALHDGKINARQLAELMT
jgi:phosphoribosylformimino-5-aminoimidazole carboxamide ribotide isomerase